MNYYSLEEVCAITDNVYFTVINELNIESKCVTDDPDTGGTKNTEYGENLYYSIENSIAEFLGVEI